MFYMRCATESLIADVTVSSSPDEMLLADC